MKIFEGYKIIDTHKSLCVLCEDTQLDEILGNPPFEVGGFSGKRSFLVLCDPYRDGTLPCDQVKWLDPKAGELKVHLFEARMPRTLNLVGKFYVVSQERKGNQYLEDLCLEKGVQPYYMDLNKPLVSLEEALGYGFKPWTQCPYFV